MIQSSKLIAAAVATAVLALAGCASQGSGAATVENLPNNCAAVTKHACKGKATCKKAVVTPVDPTEVASS